MLAVDSGPAVYRINFSTAWAGAGCGEIRVCKIETLGSCIPGGQVRARLSSVS